MGLLAGITGNASTADTDKLRKKWGKLLLPNENIEIGFKLIRDTFIFTDKRIILIDVQGITGAKTEYLSVPYKSISRFSIESAGTLDLDAELKVWISGMSLPVISKEFSRGVDIYEVQQLIAKHIC